MQGHYRDKFDILASILEVANDNAVRQAEILNKVKIPHSLFKEYLLFLYQYGLIEIENIEHQKTYRSTKKGKRFLSICNKMKTIK
jgi:predicted transcriptional regulator